MLESKEEESGTEEFFRFLIKSLQKNQCIKVEIISHITNAFTWYVVSVRPSLHCNFVTQNLDIF